MQLNLIGLDRDQAIADYKHTSEKLRALSYEQNPLIVAELRSRLASSPAPMLGLTGREKVFTVGLFCFLQSILSFMVVSATGVGIQKTSA